MTSYRHPTEKEIREAMKKYGPTRAGEGDSPYTQELLDEMNGEKKTD